MSAGLNLSSSCSRETPKMVNGRNARSRNSPACHKMSASALDHVSKVRDVQVRVVFPSKQGGKPQACWRKIKVLQRSLGEKDAEIACSGFWKHTPVRGLSARKSRFSMDSPTPSPPGQRAQSTAFQAALPVSHRFRPIDVHPCEFRGCTIMISFQMFSIQYGKGSIILLKQGKRDCPLTWY